MRRGAGVWIGLGSAALLLAAWVTTASYVPALRGALPDDRPRRHRTLGPQINRKPGELPPEKKAQDGFGFPVTLVMYALLIALLVVLGWLVFRKLVLRRRLRTRRRLAGDGEEIEEGWADASADLARSADRGLSALVEGEPRNAIIRCWTELEEAVQRTGLDRDPALTSEELTSAVLGRFAVEPAAISELGTLYREARFSEHPLTESHRDRAVAALSAVRDDLGRIAAETADAAPGPQAEAVS